ncbi:MAG: hypothetical protein M3Y13_05580 [Armatimonadota bacterium]|nr:hypothetical protein [Armatimonadota bacterium]
MMNSPQFTLALPRDLCSVCGMPFEAMGKKQQCRRCGMFANLCCDPQMPLEEGSEAAAEPGASSSKPRN